MIRWLLRTLGVEDARPQPVVVHFPETQAEARFESVRQEAESIIRRVDQETEAGRARLLSWEEFYNDPRRTR